MKKKWFAFGCLTSIIIVVIILFLIGHAIGKIGKKKDVKVVADTYLHLKLSGQIRDYNEIKDGSINPFAEDVLSAHRVIKKIEKAAEDSNIKGIILEPTWLQAGFSTLNEIVRSLENFRKSGKEIIAYLDFCGNKGYFVASAADRIYLNPSESGGIFLTGVGANLMFYKDMLDKIGVKINVVHAGKYKGAGESFTRNSISEPFRQSIDALFSDIYEISITDMAERRNIPFQDLKNIYENRKDILIKNEKALEYKLVDELDYRDNVLEKYRIDKKHLIALNDYKLSSQPKFSPSRIAVVYAQGSIAQQRSEMDIMISAEKYNKILEKLEKDNSVKAIVLRVNSPGGSALESEIILEKIRNIRKTKPFVISMGDMAASGGYYISCDSDYIVGDPYTITGSIGVVGMFPNFNRLGDKVGINTSVIKKGKYAAILNPWQEEDRQLLQEFKSEIEGVYSEFKERVAHGRKMEISEVEKVAQGRIWSSEDALENNLIDEIGGLNEAVSKAAELADLTEFSEIYFPKQKTFLEILLKEKFDFEIISNIISNDMNEELKLEEAIDFYRQIRNDPIQAIIPAEMDL